MGLPPPSSRIPEPPVLTRRQRKCKGPPGRQQPNLGTRKLAAETPTRGRSKRELDGLPGLACLPRGGCDLGGPLELEPTEISGVNVAAGAAGGTNPVLPCRDPVQYSLLLCQYDAALGFRSDPRHLLGSSRAFVRVCLVKSYSIVLYRLVLSPTLGCFGRNDPRGSAVQRMDIGSGCAVMDESEHIKLKTRDQGQNAKQETRTRPKQRKHVNIRCNTAEIAKRGNVIARREL